MPSSGTSRVPTPAPPPSRTWSDASKDPASRPATGSSGGKNYGTTRSASTRTPRSIASRPRAATSPWSPSSSDNLAHSTTYRTSSRSPKDTRRKTQTRKPTTSREANAARVATTTDDGPTYATATLDSPASAAVTGKSTSSPTPSMRSASPRASAATEGNAATAATTKRNQGFDPATLLNQPCAFHSREGKPATHTTADCHTLKEIEKARRAREDPDNNPPNGGKFGNVAGSLHTFTGFNTKREKKVITRAVAVNAVAQVDVPQFLN